MKAERIQSHLVKVPSWKSRNRKTAISRAYTFPSFRAALAFVAFVAFVGEVAEAQGHHPAINIRANKVTLTLTTHNKGGLSEKVFALARAIDGR